MIKQSILIKTIADRQALFVFKILYRNWINAGMSHRSYIEKGMLLSDTAAMSRVWVHLDALDVASPLKSSGKLQAYRINPTGIINAVGEACLKNVIA